MKNFIFWACSSMMVVSFGNLLGLGLVTKGLWAGTLFVLLLIIGAIIAFLLFYYNKLMQHRYRGTGFYSWRDIIPHTIFAGLFLLSVLYGMSF